MQEKIRLKKPYKLKGAVVIVRIAALAAILTIAKLALSFIPNVELVTVLVLVYGSALGGMYALPATLIFCAIEVALYGVGSWVPLYFAYWPALALCGCALKGGRLPLALVFGVIGSALFGVLSAAFDTLFVAASLAKSKLWAYFVAYYIRGLYFDIVHVISSFVTIFLLYTPLTIALKEAKRRSVSG